jgi:hypothetical protein
MVFHYQARALLDIHFIVEKSHTKMKQGARWEQGQEEVDQTRPKSHAAWLQHLSPSRFARVSLPPSAIAVLWLSSV